MNKYEAIFIIKNDLTEEQRNKIIDTIKNYINENGKINNIENLGEKTLAYEIKEYKKSYYYLIEFETESETIRELERIYRINSNILKFIVVRKDN